MHVINQLRRRDSILFKKLNCESHGATSASAEYEFPIELILNHDSDLPRLPYDNELPFCRTRIQNLMKSVKNRKRMKSNYVVEERDEHSPDEDIIKLPYTKCRKLYDGVDTVDRMLVGKRKHMHRDSSHSDAFPSNCKVKLPRGKSKKIGYVPDNEEINEEMLVREGLEVIYVGKKHRVIVDWNKMCADISNVFGKKFLYSYTCLTY